MKKILFIISCAFLVATAAAQQNTSSYYERYLITTQITYSGSLQRLECSVYDSSLAAWQYYNTMYFDTVQWYSNLTTSLFVNNINGIVGYSGRIIHLPVSADYYEAGAIVYDFEISQWKTQIDSAMEDSFAWVDSSGFVQKYSTSTDQSGFYYVNSTGIYYDIISHGWTFICGVYGGFGSNAGAGVENAEGIGYSYDYYSDDSRVTHYNPATHFYVQMLSHYCLGKIFSDEMALLNQDFTSNYGDDFLAAYDGVTGTSSELILKHDYNYGKVKDGIFYSRNNNSKKLYFGAYDDSLHSWKIDTINLTGITKKVLKNRVVAFADTSANGKVIYGVFSFKNHNMIVDSVPSVGVHNLKIQSGTVSWVDNNAVHHYKGYTDTSGWGNFITPPQAIFYMAMWNTAATGKLIYIKNYSIGADSVMYDFGDGYTTRVVNPYHLYKVNGSYHSVSTSTIPPYNVCLTAYGNGGSSSNSCDALSFTNCSVAGIASTNADTICSGNFTTLTLTGYSGTIQWQKYINGTGWVNITGATNNTLNVFLTQTTRYRAKVTNGLCADVYSNAVKIVVHPAPVITANGPLTFCVGDSVLLTSSTGGQNIYQWKKNGNAIAGATLQNYTATAAGNYTVGLSYATCTANSIPVTVTTPCVPPIDPNQKIANGNSAEINAELFINYFSAEQQVVINAKKLKGTNCALHVYDVLGKEVFYEEEKLSNGDFSKELNIAAFAKGMYVVNLITEKEILVRKFIKE